MCISAIVAGVGIAASIAGTAVAYTGAQAQAKAQKQALAAQQQAEEERKKAMNLDAMRKKREQIRQMQIARSQALATTNAQGASDGSGLEGAYGGISGRVGDNTLGIQQNQEIGNNIFAANSRYNAAQSDYASAGASVSMGSGLSSIGGMLMNNAGTIGKIGSYFSGGRY